MQPIDFSKLDHDRSKIFLFLISPGQSVLLQDPKTSPWDLHGVVSSIRLDQRRLLRPVTLENCAPNIEVPDSISPSLLRQSKCLQLRASSAAVNTPASVSSIFTISSLTLHQTCWDTPSLSLTTSATNNVSKNGREPQPRLPSPLLWSLRTRRTTPGNTSSRTITEVKQR